MVDEQSLNRITRYALGECSAEEAVETRAWIEADPERKALAEELSRLIDAGPASVWSAEAAWQRFREEVIEDAGAAQEAPVPASPSRRSVLPSRAPVRRAWRAGLAAAAAVAVLAFGSMLVWQATTRGPESGLVASADLRTVSTQRGQTMELYLSDGTRVVLGAASQLRFPARLGSNREVYLEGEAYFDVADVRKLPWTRKRPFTVYTGDAMVRDIGTRFSVRTYPDLAGTEVVVAEGAVALAAAATASGRAVADSLILTEGDLGRLDEAGSITVRRGVDVVAYHGWMQGQLSFVETPVQEAAERIRRWYDLDIQLGDSTLARARLTGTFDVTEQGQLLELLAILLDARVERDGKTVVLHSNRRGH